MAANRTFKYDPVDFSKSIYPEEQQKTRYDTYTGHTLIHDKIKPNHISCRNIDTSTNDKDKGRLLFKPVGSLTLLCCAEGTDSFQDFERSCSPFELYPSVEEQLNPDPEPEESIDVPTTELRLKAKEEEKVSQESSAKSVQLKAESNEERDPVAKPIKRGNSIIKVKAAFIKMDDECDNN